MSFQQNKIDFNPLNSIWNILVVVAVLVGIYYIANGIFTILAYIAPALLIGALVINYKVVTGYGLWLFDLVRQNPLLGILGIVLSVIAFPVVAGFLFAKALLGRKVKKLQEEADKRMQGEYVEYEEVEDDIVEDIPYIELPPIPKQQQGSRTKNQEGEYDQFFE
jgi:hypothetical protein